MKYDLEDRLVVFAGEIILFTKSIKHDQAGKNLKNQLVRAATSSALNYGESQAAESRRDFIHKIKLVLKELKESRVALKILSYIQYGDDFVKVTLMKECSELIAIFSTIVKNTKMEKQLSS